MVRWLCGLVVFWFVVPGYAQESQIPEAAHEGASEEVIQQGTPISLEQALLIALENNNTLRIERLDPQITRLGEDIARASFDPTLSGNLNYRADNDNYSNGQQRSAADVTFGAGLSQRLPTGGRITVDVDAKRDESTATNADNKFHTDSVGAEIKITQFLLEGRGLDVNLAAIRKARLNTAISEQQLRRYVETLIYNVTVSYWDLFLEQQKLKVFQESYELAMQHQREVEVFILNGKRPEIELATVQAEVSSRRERLVKARGAIDKQRLGLLSIMNYHSIAPNGWDEQVFPSDIPEQTYEAPADVQSYVEVALLKRPEIRESEMKLQREQIDLVVTKNGLLPKLDFFITLGNTDYSDAFTNGENRDSDEQYLIAGLNYSFGIGRRAEKARYRQDLMYEEQSQLALQNLKDSVNREIRRSYTDCLTNLESIEATSATLALRRQSLKNQQIKFEHGNATNNAIANAQRDLLQAEINHTEAMVDYVLSRMRLHYLDGSLIERMGYVVEDLGL
ncbi:MAG: TolC family protein [Puniceicoccaceae bacterium]